MLSNYSLALALILALIQITGCSHSRNQEEYYQYFLFNEIAYAQPISNFFVIGFNPQTGASKKICNVKSYSDDKAQKILFKDVFIYGNSNQESTIHQYTTHYDYKKNFLHILIDSNTAYSILRVNRGFLIGDNTYIYLDIFTGKIINFHLNTGKKTTLYNKKCISAFAMANKDIFIFCNGNIINITGKNRFNCSYPKLATEAGHLTGDWIWFSSRSHMKAASAHIYAANTQTGVFSRLETPQKNAIMLKEIKIAQLDQLCETSLK